MPSVTVTDHCPHWCSRDHSADTCGTAFYHASETASVTMSRPGSLTVPDRLDVQTAQHLPDDPGEPPGHRRSRSRYTPAGATG